MRIAVFGLGYVGSVTSCCLARAGHDVIGVDIKPERVAMVAAGVSPVVEPSLSEIMAEEIAKGRLGATTDTQEAIDRAEVSLVCVGTPPAGDGSLDVSVVESVCVGIGRALRGRAVPSPHTVAIRSTVMPGTVKRCLEQVARTSGLEPGRGVTVCANPEFLREGSGVADFLAPPFNLVGVDDPAWAEPLRAAYSFVPAPFVVVETRVAEILKAVCNAWHATKIAFANEVGRLCRPMAIDPHEVMGLFVRDTKLNLSASYLRPGFAYGGSCLPKEVAALGHLGRQHHVELPLLEGVPRSNRVQLEAAMRAIVGSGRRRIGFLGLSFKPGTDDLRSSPLVDLVEFCLGKGLRVRVHDPGVEPTRLVGANRQYALDRLGHLVEVLVPSLYDLAAEGDLFVLGHAQPAFVDFCRALPSDRHVLDLVRALDPTSLQATYEGLSW